MAMIYRTKQGEMLDLICVAYYGLKTGLTERVLEANPGLSDHGSVLPIGTNVVLPDLPAKVTTAPLQKLWD